MGCEQSLPLFWRSRETRHRDKDDLHSRLPVAVVLPVPIAVVLLAADIAVVRRNSRLPERLLGQQRVSKPTTPSISLIHEESQHFADDDVGGAQKVGSLEVVHLRPLW